MSSGNCKQREHKSWKRKKKTYNPHHAFPTSSSQLLCIHMLRNSQTFPKSNSFQCSAPIPEPFLLAPRRCSMRATWGCHGPVSSWIKSFPRALLQFWGYMLSRIGCPTLPSTFPPYNLLRRGGFPLSLELKQAE